VNPWTKCSDKLPPFNCECVVWCVGFKRHSDVQWRRIGRAFMARWDNPEETVGVNGWGRRFYESALVKLDADELQVTHWALLDEPDLQAHALVPITCEVES